VRRFSLKTGDTLAALVHLVNPSCNAPELELSASGLFPGFREKGYDREILWKASSVFDKDVGDTADELIAAQRGFYGKLFGVWKEGCPRKRRK
jgi:hypothetical protein